MVGMLQILTYMFAFYIVLKGIEILQIAMASTIDKDKKRDLIVWSVIVLVCCICAAGMFVGWQDGHTVSTFR